jgi:DNA-binding MarR family transcriptional regulator
MENGGVMPVNIITKNKAIQAWLALHQAEISIVKCEEETFANLSITPQQYYILAVIKFNQGNIKLSDIANWLDRSPNSITLIVDRMEKSGLVKRKKDSIDRRTLRLSITSKGDTIYQKAIQPAFKLTDEIMSCLSSDELQTFISLIAKVRDRTYERRNKNLKSVNFDE